MQLMDHGDPWKGVQMNRDDAQMKIRLHKETHSWLKQFAASQERSATWVVSKMIEQAKLVQEASNAQPT